MFFHVIRLLFSFLYLCEFYHQYHTASQNEWENAFFFLKPKNTWGILNDLYLECFIELSSKLFQTGIDLCGEILTNDSIF